MADLPVKPSLDHLRRQARDLLRAARAGDTTAAGPIRAVADALTLASAQLAVAREYGFASWTRLRDEVIARTASLARESPMLQDGGAWRGHAKRPPGRAGMPPCRLRSGLPQVRRGDHRRGASTARRRGRDTHNLSPALLAIRMKGLTMPYVST